MALDTHSLVQSLLNKNKQATVTQEPAAAAETVPAAPVAAATVPEETPVQEKPAEEPAAATEEAPADNDAAAADVLYPELRAKVDQAEALLDGSFLPVPQAETATEEQLEEAADLIQAYFNLPNPEDRDHVFILLAANPSPDAKQFFMTALEEDPDPYIHSQAAEVLYRRGEKAGRDALYEILDGPEDIAQFNHAIVVLGKTEKLQLMPILINIWQNDLRDSDEHIEALLGLEQLMGAGIENMLLNFIDDIDDANHVPEDELLQVLNILTRLDSAKCLPHLEALYKRLAKSVDDIADITPLLEAIDGTITLLS